MEEKKFYITKEKLKEIKREHDELVAFEHNKITGQEAPKILQSEDVNPEFISFQEDVESLRAKIDHLKSIIDNHEIIKAPPKENHSFVSIGARVILAHHGKDDEFTIVGTLEANPDAGKISNESPVGMALLGKKIGDEVHIVSPHNRKYKIKDIKYEIN